ncbi:putative virion structural protein 11 [Salmonella phage SPFM14]|nr:putative virion structural protein 11 [Salmonella phage SPFM14]
MVTQTKLDHVITFKEDCYAYLGSIPVTIPENTNPPLTNPNDPDPAPVTTLNTQYGLKLTEDDIVPAVFRNVTAYLDVKLPKTTTDLQNSGYIGTQDVTYNRLEGSAPTPISDEGADRNTSMTLTAKIINEKNPDAELELSKITLGTRVKEVRMKPLNKTSDQLVLDLYCLNFGGRLYLHYNDPD